jgi:hypothetical protein
VVRLEGWRPRWNGSGWWSTGAIQLGDAVVDEREEAILVALLESGLSPVLTGDHDAAVVGVASTGIEHVVGLALHHGVVDQELLTPSNVEPSQEGHLVAQRLSAWAIGDVA